MPKLGSKSKQSDSYRVIILTQVQIDIFYYFCESKSAKTAHLVETFGLNEKKFRL